ncbi:hypothetical protein KOR42_44670 [Thalassoglobus neptunius]|uniref:DUF58 domain-containing protein n=1 Tax=Thalassoglobus neptunius TaxID=1938619 RepID=A0A5C5VY22_9PLAN|nr:DUF58 domain-containing protein [Thalassoglobus neptunius]TWT43526.1 hypothetical protein KOR42_44670 [Thalassoglobus neptunius]
MSEAKRTSSVHVTLEQLVRLQHEAKGFSLLPRQPVKSLLNGRHGSRLRGRGLSFEELREYRPGDDIRSMDWKATARLRKPHVRVFTEDRERPVLMLVDQRSNMFFGSARATKATTAAELAALCAWRTLDVGDRVGAILFNDHDFVEIPPRRSRKSVLRICHEMVSMNQQLDASQQSSHANGLNLALRRAVNVATHDFLIVIMTDYDGDDDTTRQLVMKLARHNDVLAALIYDPLGIRLPVSGLMDATDGETWLNVPTGAKFQERYQQLFQERCDQLRQRLGALRIPILPICTHDPVSKQVLSALGQR